MAFPTKSGGKKNSKFRAARADKEHEQPEKPAGHLEEAEENAGKAPHREPGPRAQMHQMEAKPQGNPEAEAPEPEGPEAEGLEEQAAPGIHDAVKQMAAEHGPAHEVHVAHDHETGQHHVSHKHPDGFEHGQTHTSAMHAHHHAMHAAGVSPKGNEEGEYPAEHTSPTASGGEEDEYPL